MKNKCNNLENIKKFYETKLTEHNEDYKILAFENNKTQEIRFSVLLSGIDISGKKILDVGCGLCNLVGFLNKKTSNYIYTGVDIVEKFIEISRKRYPDKKIMHCDIFKNNPFKNNSFDIVIVSGAFNLRLDNNEKFIKKALKTLFDISKKTVSINLLHPHSPDRENDKFYYYKPSEIIEYLDSELPYKISRIQLFEHYLANDFTLICEKTKK
ncbi:class I SAM-dependent methyltransferase [Candidatus Dependentiae bacterium]|nr:class I SAM-dependent methyltransferase [Candidatus Dependentiae bacterium]